MAQFVYHLLHSSMYKIKKTLFHTKYYFYISFWTTLIMFGFWCECPNSFPSDLGHFEGLAFSAVFAGLAAEGHLLRRGRGQSGRNIRTNAKPSK